MSKEKFIELAKQYEKQSEALAETREALHVVMKELGYDQYAQDPETLIVYKVIKPQGTFMYYRDIDYKRTAKEGERGGTVLAKSEAQEAGFILKK